MNGVWQFEWWAMPTLRLSIERIIITSAHPQMANLPDIGVARKI
jgi:hypothetical protein